MRQLFVVFLSVYLKSVLAARTDNVVLSARLWQSENCVATRALPVNVSFSVAKFISSETEEAAEFVVFTLSFGNISREHSPKDNNYQRGGRNEINKVQNGGSYPN